MIVQGRNILVLPDSNPERTKRGIIIPATAEKLQSSGSVIEVGLGCTQVTKGDHIHYSPKSASIMEINGIAHHFISEDHVQYIY